MKFIYIRKVLQILNYLFYDADLVCTSCTFSHLFLGIYLKLLKFIESHKNLDIQNTREKKSWTHEIPTKKKLNPRKKLWNPRNTHKKKIKTQEIATRKYIGPKI